MNKKIEKLMTKNGYKNRRGVGRPKKYGEETKTVAFRCPLSRVVELEFIVKSQLAKWENKETPQPTSIN